MLCMHNVMLHMHNVMLRMHNVMLCMHVVLLWQQTLMVFIMLILTQIIPHTFVSTAIMYACVQCVYVQSFWLRIQANYIG